MQYICDQTKKTLKELRARYNLTQEELSKKLNMAKSTYVSLERDSSSMKFSTAIEIANLYRD